jgi:hypothetical protein
MNKEAMIFGSKWRGKHAKSASFSKAVVKLLMFMYFFVVMKVCLFEL